MSEGMRLVNDGEQGRSTPLLKANKHEFQDVYCIDEINFEEQRASYVKFVLFQ